MSTYSRVPLFPLPPWPDNEPLCGPLKEIWVVRHGWHTRVTVRRTDVDPSIWPESRDFGDVAYLEVGWGIVIFYPKSNPSIWDTIDPLIRATPAALHVGGLDRAPSELFPAKCVVRLSVPAHGIERLARFVHEHYVRDAAGTPRRIGSGYYPRSWFYLAEGRYHALTYNSNNWTATALKAGGRADRPLRRRDGQDPDPTGERDRGVESGKTDGRSLKRGCTPLTIIGIGRVGQGSASGRV
jgi:hypothetical protein